MSSFTISTVPPSDWVRNQAATRRAATRAAVSETPRYTGNVMIDTRTGLVISPGEYLLERVRRVDVPA